MDNYKKWLRNAYQYYWGAGDESDMPDVVCGLLAKQFAKESEKYAELAEWAKQ